VGVPVLRRIAMESELKLTMRPVISTISLLKEKAFEERWTWLARAGEVTT
jgi:hypothetical protein